MNIQLKDNNGVSVLPVPYMPVGAIVLMDADTSPASLFGGTWEQIKDKFLLAAGDVYAVGSTGGEASHKLTVDEMPEHTHTFSSRMNSGSTYSSIYAESYGTFAKSNTITFSAVGGGGAHNNMPPYTAVYAWQRIEDELEVATLDDAILDNVILG